MSAARILVILVLGTLLCLSRADAGNAGCPDVLRKVNGHISTRRGEPADLSQIARDLGTSIPWVEHCLQIYGRRAKRPGLESAEERESMMEAVESEEPEESASEDTEEGGARERPPHPQRPRYQDYHFTPTPELGYREPLSGFESP